VSTNLTL